MSDRIIDRIVNIKEEIEEIAALKDHVHTDLIPKEDIVTEINNSNSQSETKITSVKSLIEYINDQLSAYFTIEASENQNEAIQENINTILENYITTETFNAELSNVTTNFKGHSFKYPQETTDTINNIIEPGYYLCETDGSFQCDPYQVRYTNGLVRVEKQGDHLIQYVHSTSKVNNEYQLDGREYIRHGYLSNNTAGDTVTNWNDWKVHHFPYKNKDDIFLDAKGENVDNDAFHVYESTAGYIFEWKQKSTNAKYILPVNQYIYADVYTLKVELPIPQPMIFSNFIGHIDVKIVNEPNDKGDVVTKIKVRSSSNKGEYVVGVDNTYFVPRTN